MEMFDFSELDQVLLELSTLEKQGMQLNAIGNAIKEGSINRELAELSLAIDPNFIDTNYYPINSFSKDVSLVNQEVLMNGWIVNVAKSAFNVSNLSLRATVLITGAILWLINKLRKGFGGSSNNGSSGGGGSSSGGNNNVNTVIDITKPLEPFPKDISSEWRAKLEAVYKKHPQYKPRNSVPNYDEIIPLVKELLNQAGPLISKLTNGKETMDTIYKGLEAVPEPHWNLVNGESSVDFTTRTINVKQISFLCDSINKLDRCYIDGSREIHIGEVFTNVFETIVGENPLCRFIGVNHGLNVQQTDVGFEGKGVNTKDLLNNIRTDYLNSNNYGAGFLYSDIYKMLNQFDRKGRTIKFKNFGARVDVKTDWSLMLRPVQIKYHRKSSVLRTYGLADPLQVKCQFTAATNPTVSRELEKLEKLTSGVKRQAEDALAKNSLSKTNKKYDYKTFNLTAVKRSTCDGRQLGDNDNAFYPVFELLLEYNNYSCKLAATVLQEGIVGVSQRVVKDINSELVIAKEVHTIREEYRNETGK